LADCPPMPERIGLGGEGQSTQLIYFYYEGLFHEMG